MATSRREFLKGIGFLTGAAVLPSMAPQDEKGKPLDPPKALPTKMCLNCGKYTRRAGALVCSPLCAMWESRDLQAQLSIAQWEYLRTRSLALPWPEFEEEVHAYVADSLERRGTNLPVHE